MNNPTFTAAKTLLDSMKHKERKALLELYADPIKPGPVAEAGPERILRRAEVAARLSRHVRAVDRLAAAGSLHKVRLPGSKLACGFRESEVVKLIGGAV